MLSTVHCMYNKIMPSAKIEGNRMSEIKIKGLPRCKNLRYFSLFWSYCFPSLSLFCQLVVVLFVLCFTSPVSFTGSYTEHEPKLMSTVHVASLSGRPYTLK